VRFELPMMWALAFMLTFVIGGMTGVLMAVPPADFVVHNTLFLVAHFHNVIISGVLFGAFAGYAFWFPKAFGFTLDEGWGKAAFWFWVVGFIVAFAPLYVLGLEGMPRRMQSYDVPQWHVWTVIALCGALCILCGIVCQVIQLVVSIRTRERRRDLTGDPWDGRTLEWFTPSPPPEFNFAVLPDVTGEEPYWGMKARARENRRIMRDTPEYHAIEMPRNSGTGFVCAFFSVLMGFSLIWHIWWLLILGFVGAYATVVVFAWRDETEKEIPAEEAARIDQANWQARNRALAERPA
jgi:cytochrome o ubiquinol oxidase subunit 1